jgi:hypothetical protein
LNSYSTTGLRMPAAKAVAVLAVVFEIMIWVSIKERAESAPSS